MEKKSEWKRRASQSLEEGQSIRRQKKSTDERRELNILYYIY